MPDPEDLYEILQLHPSAQPEVIQAAYHRLAQLYHPDRNPTQEATERLAAINHAYSVLSDENRRAAYDRSRGQESNARKNAESKGDPIPDVIKAKSFQLVNDAGDVRAEWILENNDLPKLTMYDQDQHPRIGMHLNADGGATFFVRDKWINGAGIHVRVEENGLTHLYVEDSFSIYPVADLWGGYGSATLSLRHLDGNERLKVGLDVDGNPSLDMRDKNGNLKFTVDVDEEGKPRLSMPGFNLLVNDDSPMLFMRDQNRKIRLGVNLDNEGKPRLSMLDQNGNHRLTAYLDSNGSPRIATFDQDGNRRDLTYRP